MPVAVWVVYVHPGYGSGTGGANGVQPYDTLVCIASLSYPSENELALLKSVLGLTGYMTDSLHCSLGVSWCASTSSCLFSFFYLNWLYAMTRFLASMANSLAGV